MRSTTVTENLIQLTKFRLINAYLVREQDGFTLVDTAQGAADEIIAAAKAAGAPITRIALTHGHGDHVGSLDKLKAQLPEAEVLMPELDARIHAGEQVTEKKPTGSWPKLATVPDVRLQAGDRVGSLEVIASPGHTPGHVGFLDTRDRTLIAGDNFATVGGVAVCSHVYWKFPLPGAASFDKPQTLQSAIAALELGATALACGHGPVIKDPGAQMAAAVERARRAAK